MVTFSLPRTTNCHHHPFNSEILIFYDGVLDDTLNPQEQTLIYTYLGLFKQTANPI